MSATDRSPTQELVLEVLAARRRMGEAMWPFDVASSTVKALRQLEAAGLVRIMHGVIDRTVRASLTDDGMREMFPAGIEGSGYVSPLEMERNRLRLERDNLRRQLKSVGLS